MRLVGQARRPAGPGDLLERQAVTGIVRPRPPVFLRYRQAHQPKLGHMLEDLHREGSGPVDLRRLGYDLALGEVSDRVAYQLLIFC